MRAAPPARTDLPQALAAWVLMLLAAIANGALRDYGYARRMSELAAHRVSTASGIVLFGLVIRGYVRRYPPVSGAAALRLGLLWLALTLAFEFLFFHYVGGRPWSALLHEYNLAAGRVWVLVLGWIALAPYLFTRLNRPKRR